MSEHRTTTIMMTIAHPVAVTTEEIQAWASNQLDHRAPDWGFTNVVAISGPQIIVTDEGSGDPDIPVW